MVAHPFRRRALALAPIVLLLAVLFCGLIGWKTYANLDALDQAAKAKGLASTDFFVRQARGKIYSQNTVVLLGVFAIAGGVGAAAYFMSGRQVAGAHIGMAVPLGLAVAAIGYQAFTYATSSGPPPATSASGQSASQSPGPAPATTPAPAPAPAPSPPPPRVALNPQPPSRPTPRPASIPTIGPGTSAPTTPGSTPTPPTPPTAMRPAAAQPPAEDARIKPALEKISAEIDTQLQDVLAKTTTLTANLGRQLPRDIVVIDKRLADAAALSKAGSELAKRLRDLTDEARKALDDAGLSDTDTLGPAIRYSQRTDAFMRASAADDLARLGDDAREEAQFLRDNFPKWRLDAKGELTSQDVMIKGQARGMRMRIEMDLKRKDDVVKRLTGS